MSYQIIIRIKDGEIAATRVSGLLPDGQFEITGHEDDNSRFLAVTRRNAEGKYAAAASRTHPLRSDLYPAALIDIE